PHGHYNFDMIFGDGSETVIAAAAAAAMGGGGGHGFQSGVLDASLAASVCGIGIPGISDTLPPHLMAAHQQPQQLVGHGALLGSLMGSHPVDGGRSTPVVFRSTVERQQQPAADAVSLDVGRPSITLHGANFTPDMVVMFDGQRSLYTEVKSSECIVCIGPLESEVMSAASASDSEAGGSASEADTEQLQAGVPTSPSASDASSGHAAGDDGDMFGMLDAATPRVHRASSADSTASSATATHSSRGVAGNKGAGGAVKVDIHLACNNGAGPKFNTGQSYTVLSH
ncbi:hypothetical protein H4R21_002812, partial [Coemansia helicoidea]